MWGYSWSNACFSTYPLVRRGSVTPCNLWSPGAGSAVPACASKSGASSMCVKYLLPSARWHA